MEPNRESEWLAERVMKVRRLLSQVEQAVAVAGYCEREQHYGQSAERRSVAATACRSAITELQHVADALAPVASAVSAASTPQPTLPPEVLEALAVLCQLECGNPREPGTGPLMRDAARLLWALKSNAP